MPAPMLPCKHCRRLVPRLDVDEPALQAVVRTLRNGGRTLAAMELKHYAPCRDTEAQVWTDHLLSCAYAWPLPEGDRNVCLRIDLAFADVQKSEHFTDYTHCDECRDHDDTLRARTRDTLRREDLGNCGWDPITFCSEEGIGYFFPVLARFALLPDAWRDHGWYCGQLLSHLSRGNGSNGFLAWCSPKQRDAVHDLLQHLMDTRLQDIADHWEEDALLDALSAWAPPKPSPAWTP